MHAVKSSDISVIGDKALVATAANGILFFFFFFFCEKIRLAISCKSAAYIQQMIYRKYQTLYDVLEYRLL